MSMDYRVLVVENDQLPDGTDWVICRANGVAYFMIKRCRFSVDGGLCDLLQEAWAARVASEESEASRLVAV